MRIARSALAAAAACALIWPGMVALRAVPVLDADAPRAPSTASVPHPGSVLTADAAFGGSVVDDQRPRVTGAAAGRAVAAPVTATVRAAVRPAPRPPTTPPAIGATRLRGAQEVLAAAYRLAVTSVSWRCHLEPADLAAIGQIESGSLGGHRVIGHRAVPQIVGPLLDGGPFAVVRDTDGGRYDGSAQYDRAVGPMQFLPGTWAWAGRDGDGDGVRDPQNVFDASFTAAAYLCRGGRDLSRPAELRAAFWSYNQSSDYVSAALAWVSYFERNGLGALGAVDIRVASGGRASELGPRPTAKTAPRALETLAPAKQPRPASAGSGGTPSPPMAPTPGPSTATVTTASPTTTPSPTTTSSPTSTTPSPTTTSPTTTTASTASPTPTDTATTTETPPATTTTVTPSTQTPTTETTTLPAP